MLYMSLWSPGDLRDLIQNFMTVPQGLLTVKTNDPTKTYNWGRAIAQAFSRRLPTAAARVRARVRLCGIRGEQRGTGAGFLRVLRFHLPIRIPPIAVQSSRLSSEADTIGQTVAEIPSGLSLTPREKKTIIRTDIYIIMLCTTLARSLLLIDNISIWSSRKAVFVFQPYDLKLNLSHEFQWYIHLTQNLT
jgi:hypothetical protein